jgi:hypothetical protein
MSFNIRKQQKHQANLGNAQKGFQTSLAKVQLLLLSSRVMDEKARIERRWLQSVPDATFHPFWTMFS